jgi:hypothetical protein
MGNDNPYAALWTLIGAKLFSRPDGTVLDPTVQGTSPLIGSNWSNSVNPVLGAQDKCNATMEIMRINSIRAQIRRDLGFEDVVRFEHHITETYRSIVRQPYDRLEELLSSPPPLTFSVALPRKTNTSAAVVGRVAENARGAQVQVTRAPDAAARTSATVLHGHPGDGQRPPAQ